MSASDGSDFGPSFAGGCLALLELPFAPLLSPLGVAARFPFFGCPAAVSSERDSEDNARVDPEGGASEEAGSVFLELLRTNFRVVTTD